MSAAHQVVAAKKQTTICEASIVAATFNATKTQIAFSPNNNLVYIADVVGDDCTQWKIKETLAGHDQAVSCIDWSPVTEKLLTCSHDRTAFVWTRAADKGPWQPVLILLDSAMKHGFTCCKWSLSGLKLYVSCASSTVAVGKYDEESDWWRCSVFKPHCSSVTCVAPHTVNDSLLATAATDHTVKVISTFTKSIDPPESRLAKLGAEVAHFDVQSWVNAIAWSESGCILAVACHDSSVTIFSGSHPTDFANWSAQVILLPQLPLRAIAFVAEDAVVGGGHDYYPVYFAPGADGQWAVKGTGAQITKKADEKLTGTQAARLRFQNEASHGTTESVELPKTRHSNTVTSVLPLPRKRFATASADGRVEIWALDQLLS